MTGRIRVYPYKQGSASARAIAASLGGKVLFTDDNRRLYRPRPEDVVVNWGASDMPMTMNGAPILNCLNKPEHVARASNKLRTFESLPEAIVPPFTKDRSVAQQWFDEDKGVVARTRLTAKGGEGILMYFREDGNCSTNDIVAAPLYTQYIKKRAEFRIHLIKHPRYVLPVIFDVQQKRKRRNDEEECEVDCDLANTDEQTALTRQRIRNYDNGWVFTREDVVVPDAVYDVAVTAFAVSELDFGAIDVVFNEYHNRAYVLEINTAPGLEGTTLENYTYALMDVINAGWYVERQLDYAA